MDWDDMMYAVRTRAGRWAHGLYRGMNTSNTFDRAQWFDAAMQREQGRPPISQRFGPRPWDRSWVEGYLNKKNYWRMRRLRKDMRWLRRQLIKLGIDPRDAGGYIR